MFEFRPPYIYLALSSILHAAILVLPDIKISPNPAWTGSPPANTTLSIAIVPHKFATQAIEPTGAELFPSNTEKPSSHPPTTTIKDNSPGLRGENEENPVVELSIDDYLPPSLLDKIPFPIESVNTNIDFKGMNGLVGEAEIMVLISSEGNVNGVLVMTSSLPEFIVDEAVSRFKTLTFEPGELQGMKVRSRIRIKLTPPTIDELRGNPYSAKQRAWRR